MRKLPYLWLDVFAERPFAGNALCVILDGSRLTDEEMQAVARETNLSETSFVLAPTQPGATYRNRIFTPGRELAFAGHPTLGTAAALVLAGKAELGELVQETKYGLTPVEVTPHMVIMEAPAPSLAERPDPERVARALGMEPGQVAPWGLRPEIIAAGVRHMVIPVESPEVLAGIQPDTAALTALSRELNVAGAYPFTMLPSGGSAHARARLFAPLYGIPEDPATGSAAAPLGAYLHWHGLMPEGSREFWYEQGMEMGRPSRLWVEVSEQESGLRVRVGGQVQLLGRGEFEL